MRPVIAAALAAALALTGDAAAGPDLSGLYSEAELVEKQARYAPNLLWNFENMVLGMLTPDERARLGQVELVVPLYAEGDMRGNPLAFYAGGRTVTMPALSVKFYDDLTLAWAFFTVRGLSIEPVTDYLGMLKYRDPREVGGRFAPPLEALGVPADIWRSDAQIDDISQKALKSALVWVMAHELGHIYFGHGGYAGISAAEARRSETEADRFATAIMRRIGIAPMGMAPFFMMMAHFEANAADFKDQAAWEAYQARSSTHPVTAARLIAIAEEMERAPEDFVASEPDQAAAVEVVISVATQMRGIGRLLNDPDVQQAIAMKALATDPRSLRRWQTSVPGGEAGMPFAGRYRGTYVYRIAGGGSESLAAELDLKR